LPIARTSSRLRLRSSAFSQSAAPLPDGVEAGEVELALRGEVPVEHRLGDAGLARDLRRGRAAVAALGEDAAGRLDDRARRSGRERPALTPAASTRRLASAVAVAANEQAPRSPAPRQIAR
jgi:hypothetical protein